MKKTILSPEQMRTRSLENNKAIRKWAEENKLGTKPATKFTKIIGRGLERRVLAGS